MEQQLKELERTAKELFKVVEPSQLVDILCDAAKEKCVRVEEGLINDTYIFEDGTEISKDQIIKLVFDFNMIVTK